MPRYTPHSEETKRKIGDAHRGKPHSEETKRKISEAKKGKPGHPHTEESRRKMSESNKRANNKGWGHPHTEESRRKIGDAHRGVPDGPKSEEQKRQISATMKGRTIPEEVIEKRRKALMGHEVSEETRQKISEANTGKKQPEEVVQKKREIGLKLASDPEYLKRVGAGVRRAYETTDMPERLAKAMSVVYKTKKRTSIEIAIADVLDALEIEYEPQKRIGRYHVDFYIPSKNLVIECDGAYWHSREGMKEKDAKKDNYLASQGYTILRLPEEQICKNELEDFYEALW